MKIGNCIVFGKPKSMPIVEKAKKHSKNVQIVGMDGKIMELKTPTTVGEFLVKFSGFNLVISLKATQVLHSSYKLKKGIIYYLVPVPKIEEKQEVKRIRVVITKQQLQELLARQKSVEDVLLGVKIESFCSVDDDYSSSTYLKKAAKLEPIPEEIE